MKTILVSLLATILAFLVVETTAAQSEGMGVVTGSSTGTYVQFGNDMARVAKDRGLDLLVKNSEGSLDNIRRMMSKENAAVGIVQSDVLGFLSRSEDRSLRLVTKRLRLIFPFYNEEIHLLARRDIKSFEELDGKRVVVGTKGSGNWLTATNLLHMMDVQPAERLHLDPLAAATAVLLGKADAMFYVAGKPVKLFTNLTLLSQNANYENLLGGVHFIPLNDPRMLEEYVGATLGSNDYSWMTEEVPTVAVKAVLVGFDFKSRQTPYYRARCDQVGQLASAVRDQIGHLRETGHAKWKQVDLDQDIGIWQWDPCSRPDVATAAITPSPEPEPEPQPEPASDVAHAVKTFKDCADCPEMVEIPAGDFVMGSKTDSTERPPHTVKITNSFAIAKYEVSTAGWKACMADGACPELPKLADAGDNMPVRNVAWTDTLKFVAWLSKKTQRPYRLPTEAEWEYAGRANTTTKYWWGNRVGSGRANCKDCGGDYDRKKPTERGLYTPNPYGLHDMNGGVWEWVADCWHRSYAGHPDDGSGWDEVDCRRHVVRGGSWRNDASYLRSASRFFYDADVRYSGHGFRVAVQLN